MSATTRRSSIVDIDEFLDKCSGDEPDSVLYDPDYAKDVGSTLVKLVTPGVKALGENLTDICTKIGLGSEILDERVSDLNECYSALQKSLQEDLETEYKKLCHYKEDLLTKVQKMLTDLYLPAYIPKENITLLQHCKRLKTEYNKLNVVREKRMLHLKELRDKQMKLCIALGIKSPEAIKMRTDIPTEDELSRFAAVIVDLEKEERRRKEKYRFLIEMIKKCADLLELPCPSVEGSPTSEENLSKLTEMHSKMEAQYVKNQQKFDKLRDTLVSLYDRLDITERERDDFLGSHATCKPSLMAEMEIKIAEYEELKKQNIGKFIEKIKDEIVTEYDSCYLPQGELEPLLKLADGDASEELLELFESKLEELKKYQEKHKDILERFKRWNQMFVDILELEKRANDPSRFNNRGGQLLAEEKKRKALQKGLPKIEKELKDMSVIYAQQNGGAKFKVFGTSLDDYIDESWAEINHYKEEQKKEKKERQRAKMTPIKKSTPASKVMTARNTPLPLKRAAAGGSRLLGPLSISEQEFEEMAVTRPTSAKRPAPNRFGFAGR